MHELPKMSLSEHLSLQNIFPNRPDPRLDSTESPTSMVFNMASRERARRPSQRVHGPLPELSSFVAAAGAEIPQPRVTTEMNISRQTRARTTADIARGKKGRGRGEVHPNARRGRGASGVSALGRGASADAGSVEGASAGAGRGRGANAGAERGRGANAGAERGRGANAGAGRGRGGSSVNAWRGENSDAGRGRGGQAGERAWWLMFGDIASHIPDLNAPPDDFPAA